MMPSYRGRAPASRVGRSVIALRNHPAARATGSDASMARISIGELEVLIRLRPELADRKDMPVISLRDQVMASVVGDDSLSLTKLRRRPTRQGVTQTSAVPLSTMP
jgi:hypothetical protein